MGDDDDPEAAAFPRALAQLKREGANVLVVGAVPEAIHERVSSKLLGTADGSTPRRRVLAYSGVGPESTERRLPADGNRDRDHLRVLVQDLPVRSGTTATDAGVDRHGPATGNGRRRETGTGNGRGTALPVTTVPDDLGEFGAAITGAIDDLEPGDDGLDPADLRLCLDSVASLLGSHDRSAVLVFLHLVAERVDAVDGLGHYHLPVDRSEEVVSTLVPLFDVTVELRVRCDVAEQRWHLLDDVSSEWLPLDPEG